MADDVVLKDIKLVAFDCDGVLTDSKLHYLNGEISMSFNTRDGEAIRLFQEAGIETALISTNKFSAPVYRALDLNIPHVWTPVVQEWSEYITSLVENSGEVFLEDYDPWPKEWIESKPHLFSTKLEYFNALCYSLHILPEQCVYVGDTNTDIPLLKVVGYPFVPYDHAITELFEREVGRTAMKGGEGVLFDVWNFFY